jgi:hypothetical protein
MPIWLAGLYDGNLKSGPATVANAPVSTRRRVPQLPLAWPIKVLPTHFPKRRSHARLTHNAIRSAEVRRIDGAGLA